MISDTVWRSYFNPLAPRGARHFNAREVDGQLVISIHSPLAGRDRKMANDYLTERFQSTRPSRGETSITANLYYYGTSISIHSPLAGRDERLRSFERGNTISIHSPLAGRD